MNPAATDYTFPCPCTRISFFYLSISFFQGQFVVIFCNCGWFSSPPAFLSCAVNLLSSWYKNFFFPLPTCNKHLIKSLVVSNRKQFPLSFFMRSFLSYFQQALLLSKYGLISKALVTLHWLSNFLSLFLILYLVLFSI